MKNQREKAVPVTVLRATVRAVYPEAYAHQLGTGLWVIIDRATSRHLNVGARCVHTAWAHAAYLNGLTPELMA